MICPHCNNKISFFKFEYMRGNMLTCYHCEALFRLKNFGLYRVMLVLNCIIGAGFGYKFTLFITNQDKMGAYSLLFFLILIIYFFICDWFIWKYWPVLPVNKNDYL